jgi:2-(1,2-epoxy-1,2-dihydrophenyl)acetyl-CoA isomerase
VLRGAGRHFSTGGDVARFAEAVAAGEGRAYAERVVGGLNRAILRLAALPCPVIAQVQGALTGGALGLVLAADLVSMDRAPSSSPSTCGSASRPMAAGRRCCPPASAPPAPDRSSC